MVGKFCEKVVVWWNAVSVELWPIMCQVGC